MIRNLAVPVTFKVYTEFFPNYIKLRGNPDTAEEPQSGYVYIYRELRSAETNDDATRVRLWDTVDMTKSTETTLMENAFGEVNNYFFAYSKEALPATRIETIRKDIHSKIISRSNITVPQEMPNDYVRACYIPLIKENAKRKYLIGNEDVIYKTPESTERTVILLYDWYGYLEQYADEYQEKLQEYHSFMEEEITLSDYNTHSIEKTLSTGNPLLMNQYNDRFKFKDLYPLTDMIDRAVGMNSKKIMKLRCHQNVLMEHYYPISHIVAAPGEPEETVHYIDSHNVPVYKDFLQQYSKKMQDFQDDFKPIVDRIISLLEDNRANTVFNDYMYDETLTQDLFQLLGKALEHTYMTVKPAESERFSRLLDKAFMWRSILSSDILTSIRTASDLHKQIGDWSIFRYLFTIDNVTYINDVSSNILDALVSQFSKTAPETQLCGYVTLTHGLMRTFKVRRDVFEHTPQQVKNLRDSGHYIDMTVEQAWFSKIDNYLNGKGISGARMRITGSGTNERWSVELPVMEVLDHFDLSPEEMEALMKQPNITRKIIDTDNIIAKCGLAKSAKDAAIKIGTILAAFNIMMELALIQESEGILECIPHYVNIVGSLIPIADHVTQFAHTRFLGPAAFFVSAAAYIVKIKISLDKGEPGSAFFNMGAAVSFTGAGLTLMGISSAPALAWVAGALICSMLAEYFTYDDLDYYLEYCIWGIKYKEDWVENDQRLPSWWPSNKFEPEAINGLTFPIRIGDTIRKRLAYRLYSRSNEENILANRALFDMVQQIPPYKITAIQNGSILEYSYPHHFVLSFLNVHDFSSMDSMEVILS